MADTEELLSKLTLEEKASLTAGDDMMSTVPVERLGIPEDPGHRWSERCSRPELPRPRRSLVDVHPVRIGNRARPGILSWPRRSGPTGRTGGPRPGLSRPPRARRSTCIVRRWPDGTSSATRRTRSSPAASPPATSGGCNPTACFATVKHFVANEAEFERGSISSVDRRARPAGAVPRFPSSWPSGRVGSSALMTAYNRVNGTWVTEQRALLIDLLRDEWGFEGICHDRLVRDRRHPWLAGCRPRPGDAGSRGDPSGQRCERPVEAGAGSLASDLDDAVMRLLDGLDRIGALDAPTPPIDPRAADRPRSRPPPAGRRRGHGAAHQRRHPPDSTPRALRQVAVIGPNASTPRIQGGGSAQVMKRRQPTMIDPLASALGDVAVVVERGCEVDRSATVIGRGGPPGDRAASHTSVFDGSELAGESMQQGEARRAPAASSLSTSAQGYPSTDWSMRIRGSVVSDESGTFEMALAQSGRARVLARRHRVLDGFVTPPPPGGSDFFGGASQDTRGRGGLRRPGWPSEFVVEYARAKRCSPASGSGTGPRHRRADRSGGRGGGRAADVAVVFVGTTEEWETEGHDRDDTRICPAVRTSWCAGSRRPTRRPWSS